ncbi:MAG: hypothetical protein NZ840_04455 [Anaerolineales bacterium]|nr:hypothetical protein [Anaerolineales bacterium]MDW8161287.1 hypothetical protein [Anaerolineales bacterium]
MPLLLFGLSVLAYGVLLPQMGFYWDDWPWVWLHHIQGKAGMLAIDREFRPLSGVTLWFFSLIAGERPLLWQTINFLLRWLSGVACFLALSTLFPCRKVQAAWAATLLLLYPAYTHQFVAVNSSRHLLPFLWFFLSLWLMVRSVRSAEFSRRNTVAALALQGVGMLTTEYFYGLELARPLFLWFALGEVPSPRERLKNTLLRSLPFSGLFFAVVLWRYLVTRSPGYSNYPLNWFEETPTAASSFLTVFQEWAHQLYVSLILGWVKIAAIPQLATFGTLKTVAYWLVVGSAGAWTALLLPRLSQEEKAPPSPGMIPLGVVITALGGLPFLAAGLTIEISFPASRLTLPMALGTSLLLVGLVERIPIPGWGKLSLIAVICGFAVGAHFQNAVLFRRDWSYQRSFFEQLRWRAPQIQPGTLLLSNVILETHSSDNSLTAALNWLYFERFEGEKLPLMFFYVRTRQAAYFPDAAPSTVVERRYGRFLFRGSTDRALVVFYKPPACLRLVHPEFDRRNPTLSRDIRQVAHLSNLSLVGKHIGQGELDFPLSLRETDESWCYFYQKADLARQLGDWKEVISWWERSAEKNLLPRVADERIPFIQAYAFTGDWAKALELTQDATELDSDLTPLLCRVWNDLRQKTPSSVEQQEAFQKAKQKLGCDG